MNTIDTKYKFRDSYVKLLAFILVAIPFADMATGYGIYNGYMRESDLASPSQIARFLAVILMFAVVVRYRISIRLLYLLLPLLFTELVVGFFLQDIKGFLVGVVYLYKIGYIILLGCIVNFALSIGTRFSDLYKFMCINLVIVSGSIYIGFLSGLGNSTYGWGFGTKGFFASGNGLGIYIGVAVMLVLGMSGYLKRKKVNIVFFIFVTGGLLLLGTKTAAIMFVVLFIYYILIFDKKVSLAPYVLIFISGSAILLTDSSDLITSGFANMFDVIISRFESSASVRDYVAGARIGYANSAATVFFLQESSVFRIPFGSGAFLSFQDPNQVANLDTLESDVVDTFYMYGVYGLFAYLYWIYSSGVRLKKYKEFFVGFFLLAAHSFTAGHVLFNGMCATLIAILLGIALCTRTNRVSI